MYNHIIEVGNLVKLKDGSSAIIVKIEPVSPYPWAVLHTGEKWLLRDLEVIHEPSTA